MKPHNDKAIWFVVFVNFLFLVLFFIFLEYQFLQFKNNFQDSVPANIVYQTLPPISSASPSAASNTTSTPIPTVSPNIIVQSPQAKKITYLPVTGGSTQATDWTSIAGSQFTLNISDYGTNAYSIWDANLRVDNANGETFARLYDTTHNIAVNGSEINVSNTSTGADMVSGSLSFWAGNNTYVVQLKSLNSSTAFMDSGRIKITY